MRKILLLLTLMLFSTASYAQVYFGGSLGFWRDSKIDHTSYKVLPEAGYVMNQKWAVGAVFGYKYTKSEAEEYNTIVFTPYLRYFFMQSGIVKCFVDGAVDLAGTSDADDDHSSTAWGVGLKPGISISLSQRLSIVAHLGYLGYRHAGNYPAEAFGNGFGVDLSGESLTFGLYYSF